MDVGRVHGGDRERRQRDVLALRARAALGARLGVVSEPGDVRRSTANSDTRFTASISERYESYLVPLIFEPYATRLVDALPTRGVAVVIEIACGTGVVTRALADRFDATTTIVATDLNQAMLDQGASVGTSRPVEWRQADAMHLPFESESFDVVVCQFGAMFFPDRA